jgi:hypothetical protein
MPEGSHDSCLMILEERKQLLYVRPVTSLHLCILFAGLRSLTKRTGTPVVSLKDVICCCVCVCVSVSVCFPKNLIGCSSSFR